MRLHKLTQLQVKNATDGYVGDGGGLWLRTKHSSKSWCFRYTFRGKAREMGLGPYPVVSLAEARDKAAAARKQVAAGIDPLTRQDRDVTMADILEQFISAMRPKWTAKTTEAQWRNSLNLHAGDILKMAPSQVDAIAVKECLDRIWQSKPTIGRYVQQRLDSILNFAIAAGHRKGPSPAAWEGNLEHLMPPLVIKHRHIGAVSIAEASQVFTRMWAMRKKSLPAATMCFVALTVMRSIEVSRVEWGFVGADVIEMPPHTMKGRRLHRTAITPMLRELLGDLPRLARRKTLFVKGPQQRVFCDRLGIPSPHGWRACFSTWCGENDVLREHREMQLTHLVGTEVERAYQRGDYLEQRRQLMVRWENFLRGA